MDGKEFDKILNQMQINIGAYRLGLANAFEQNNHEALMKATRVLLATSTFDLEYIQKVREQLKQEGNKWDVFPVILEVKNE